jgi:hypothetical protein
LGICARRAESPFKAFCMHLDLLKSTDIFGMPNEEIMFQSPWSFRPAFADRKVALHSKGEYIIRNANSNPLATVALILLCAYFVDRLVFLELIS